MKKSTKILVVIAGPTAVGKTHLGITLALHWGIPIFSADSRQLYKELNIGTAKPSATELNLVPHYFINHLSIHDCYTVADYAKEADEQLDNVFLKRDIALLVGGSGLFIQALTHGLSDIPKINPEIRKGIMQRLENEGLAVLREEIESIDPTWAQTADLQNPRRIIRALEVWHGTGHTLRSFHEKEKAKKKYQVVYFNLCRDIETLYSRINQRADQMIDSGLLQEAKELMPFRENPALKTVGYQEFFPYFEGLYDKEEAIRLFKRNSRRYAKRQITWFNRIQETIDISIPDKDKDESEIVSSIINQVNCSLSKL